MTIPLLFEEYPSLEGIIPWIQLIKSPTQVKRLERLEEALKTNTHVWIKLDNLTSSQYGGNKVRKLEFIIGQVLKKKKKTIATLGGIGTNHGLATTIYGKEELQGKQHIYASRRLKAFSRIHEGTDTFHISSKK